MSNIKMLLEDVEVEWKTLEEVAENVSSGGTPSTGVEEYYGGNIPWLRTQEVGNGEIWNTDIKITELGLKNSSAKMIPINCVIVAMYGATVGKVGINKIPLCTNQACANIQINEKIANYRYVYHYLLSQYEYIKSLGAGSQTNINSKIVKSILIPIPCPDNPEKSLEIQKEVVRILDKFSTLTAELQAELQARKSQYEYYRNQLLTHPIEESNQPSLRSSQSATFIQNNDNPTKTQFTPNPHTGNSVLQPRGKVEWKTLGEIGDVCMCKRILKEQTSDAGDIPFYKIGTFGKEPNAYISKELFDEYKSKYSYPKIGEVLISASGTIGRAVIFDGRDAYFQDSNIVWIENDESLVLNRYLFYVYQIVKWEISEGGTIQRLYNDNLKKTRIPIPYPNDIKKSLEEQERIVSILDKFDTLTTSITEGLPKEIELRQKQYEYYRDMLLTFPTDNI